MGQRHQIFVILPYEFKQLKEEWGLDPNDSNNYVESNIVAIHHQWLYGLFPIRRLVQFNSFYKKNVKQRFGLLHKEGYNDKIENFIEFMWRTNLQSGEVSSSTCILGNDSVQNPLGCDNNDGYTVIDIREKGKLKYCFVGPDGELPLSAEEYMELYLDGPNDEDIPEFKQLVKKTAKLQVMTFDELKEVFPQLIPEGTTEDTKAAKLLQRMFEAR